MTKDILFNKTKIVATVGPACSTKEKLIELIRAGVDVFRLNFSHGTHEDHLKVINFVKEINEELNTTVCLLQDLQGPKIRIREVENGEVEIKPGDDLIITSEKMIGNSKKVSTTYKGLIGDVSIGDTVLIDDGKIELKVKEVRGEEVVTEIIHGGMLKSRKGINMPHSNVSAPSLTEKDLVDLEFGLENDVHWIALSFVRSAKDVVTLKKLIQEKGKQIRVISKIEKPEAMHNIDEIIEESDALMVARGDLGVEIVMEEVPMAQKLIVSKCNQACKPVIIATQMMESMIESPRPTRAETNDIANAVIDGADALMLSAETSTGNFPVKTVQSMARTIASVEKNADIYNKFYDADPDSPTFYSDSLVLTACRLSRQTRAKAIIGMTKSGYTAFRISCHRPKAHIFVFTDNRPLLNTMNLIWGVRGYYYDAVVSTDSTIADIENILKEKGHIKSGELFISTASMPIHMKLRTNMLKINLVE